MVHVVPRYVAWRKESYCDDSRGWTVKVRRIGRQTKAREYDTGATPSGQTAISFGIGPARAIAIDKHGALAWIAQDKTIATPTYEVWRIAHGKPVRLARGTEIDPKRLHINGLQTKWFEAGQPNVG